MGAHGVHFFKWKSYYKSKYQVIVHDKQCSFVCNMWFQMQWSRWIHVCHCLQKSKRNSLPCFICPHHLAFFVTSLESLHKKQNEHKIKWKHNNEKSHHDDLLDALLKLQESDQLDTHLKTNQIKVVSMARSLGTNQQNTNTHTHTMLICLHLVN